MQRKPKGMCVLARLGLDHPLAATAATVSALKGVGPILRSARGKDPSGLLQIEHENHGRQLRPRGSRTGRSQAVTSSSSG